MSERTSIHLLILQRAGRRVLGSMFYREIIIQCILSNTKNIAGKRIQWCCDQRNPEAQSRVEEDTWNIGSRLQNQEALQWAVLGWGQPLGACSKTRLKERESCGSRGFCGSWQPLKAHRAFTSLFLSLQLPLMLADCVRGNCKAGPEGGGGKQARGSMDVEGKLIFTTQRNIIHKHL